MKDVKRHIRIKMYWYAVMMVSKPLPRCLLIHTGGTLGMVRFCPPKPFCRIARKELSWRLAGLQHS